ncbi:GntR family transcriptional regulator [Roseomonas sp. SSH11]|uniref:GntR family transcriptional regulator n=1 Tax=Pararoseomonas baculiformis TaxID=2820812 RepID=A0ABS4AJ40_9PROT|nr:GntR family transcriptional regulator [Pararoseomonas baculiformis]MBP0446891.1 GntR family transcriptional regulator [Pararoseomonas baculiformis]
MPGRKLHRQTVVESATDELRRRILSGEFREGEALRQDALAEEFGISRIPLREAFRQLAAEGLVTIHPHRGAVVSSLSPEEIAELFDLRALLEPDLIRRAVPRLGPADLAGAETILAAYSAAIDRADLNAWGELNTEYHLALYRPAGRAQTLALVRTLLANTDRYTRLQLAVAGGTDRAKAEHAELLEICRRGAAEEAARFTRRHVLEVKRDLLRLIAAAADDAPMQAAD